MKKQRNKYVVTHIETGKTFETTAVSEDDAINHIHYNLYFGSGIWTEMDDFKADTAASIKYSQNANNYSKLSDSLKPAIDYLKRTWGI